MASMISRLLTAAGAAPVPLRAASARRRQPAPAPLAIAEFLDQMVHAYGADAAAARHEAYFIYTRGGKLAQALRGVAALCRDILHLYRGPRAATATPAALAIVTLRGASGWGTLEPAVSALRARGYPVALVLHDRAAGIAGPGACLPRPARGACRAAGAAAAGALSRRHPLISATMVASVLARRQLWLHAWRAMAPSVAHAVVVHNDFDMMSATAVEALRGRVPSICVQHGVPTDEFFPARADWHVVWGSSSRDIYARRGVAAERIIIDPLTRGVGQQERDGPPHGILLVSQTHTTVYGLDLAWLLGKLASALASSPLGDRFTVLLHPEESRLGHPYPGAVNLRQGREHLDKAAPRQLVIGFSSTAIIEAALAGHYVAALGWQPRTSVDAHRVAAPPMTVADDPAAVLALFEHLRDNEAARLAHESRQREWLAATFAPPEQIKTGLAPLIERFAKAGDGH